MRTTTSPISIEVEDEEEFTEEELGEAAQAVASAIAEQAISYPANVERRHQRVLRRKIERALDEKHLQWCCTADDLDFADYGELTAIPGQPAGADFYIYKDNGSDILAIAHLDSVAKKHSFFRIEDDYHHGDIICSPTLDDRLGAYVILELLPKLGIKTDILLTIGEEMGRSTAAHFDTDKTYNWMFQFDRMGTDVVMYQYHTAARTALLRSVLAWPAHGMFSDISSLGHLGCAGFNWGVGYHDYHGPRAWASIHELILQVARFARFYDRYRGMRMAYTKPIYVPRTASNWGGWSPGKVWDTVSKSYVDKDDYDWDAQERRYVPKAGKRRKGGKKANGQHANFQLPGRVNTNGRVVIPEIDDQLKGLKRGSRRGQWAEQAYDRLEEFERCLICNAILDSEGECDACGWSLASEMASETQRSIFGMTEEEFRRYEGRAALD